MRSNDFYMGIAIDEAVKSKQNGGVAIGAVLVDETGEVVAKGGSIVKATHDPTAHAEINAIRIAAQNMASDDLFGLTLYSTLEPCHMCLSAAAWARISHIYFGAYKKDVDESLFDIKGDYSDEQEGLRMNLRENLSMTVVKGVLEGECASLLAKYHDDPRHADSVV